MLICLMYISDETWMAILDETLLFKQHIEQRAVHKAASPMYALKVLWSRGLNTSEQLWDVIAQTLVACILLFGVE